jgi:transcriptional regulator with XRE-family HTH domain
MAFGELLRKLREERGMSQGDLAERSGLKQTSISRWEKDANDPPWTAVQKLAAALGVDCRSFANADGDGGVSARGRRKKV